jgi:hypothetical protein
MLFADTNLWPKQGCSFGKKPERSTRGLQVNTVEVVGSTYSDEERSRGNTKMVQRKKGDPIPPPSSSLAKISPRKETRF